MRAASRFFPGLFVSVSCVATAVVGCGGASKPAASAETAESPAEDAETNSESSKAESGGTRSDSESASGGEKEAPKEDAESAPDLNVILQRVIEDPELGQYLHLNQPGRFPLKVSGKDLPSGLSLTMGTKPVAVVEGPGSKKDAVLVFTRIEASAKQATVAYRYDIEGVTGTVRLEKSPSGWELTSSRVVEH